MNRRHALRLRSVLSWPPARRQSVAQNTVASLRRIGVHGTEHLREGEVILKPFFDEMRALGRIQGQTIVHDRAYADDRIKSWPSSQPNWWRASRS